MDLMTRRRALLAQTQESGVLATATGNPMTFVTDMVRNLKSLVIPFTTISGIVGCSIVRTGTNLFDQDTVYSAFMQQDGSFLGKANTILGVRPTIPAQFIGKELTWSAYIKIPSGSTAKNPRALAHVGGSDISGNFISSDDYTRSVVTFTPTTTEDYICISYGSGGSQNIQIENCQLEINSSVTAYEPYDGDTISVSWQTVAGTVYDGTLTVNEDGNGTLVVTNPNANIYTLSNIQVVETLNGTNTIWTDTNGTNTAEYWIKNT